MISKASKNLDRAKTNYAKALEFEEEMKTAATLCNSIRRRADMFNRFLIRLQSTFDPLVYEMSRIISNNGTGYRNYSAKDKEVNASAMTLAGAIKSVLDTPILDNEGNLTRESENIIDLTQIKIDMAMA